MRAKDFLLIEAQNLFEVNMSPSNLKKLAGKIDAKVGIEFEMLVPDVGSVDDDYESEPEEDMDYDERVDDIEDICRFFDDREYNVRSDISELRDELNDKFQDWLSDKIREEWDSPEGREFFAKWCRENVREEDVADQVDTPEDLLGDRIPSKEDWEKFIEEEWEAQDRNYENAFDEYRDEKVDDGDFDENAFLSDIGINYMSDVPSRVRSDITWPHWTYPESGGDAEYNLQQVAEDFSEAVGMPANYSTSYHGGYRSEGEYDIEPDSSLHGNGDDAGLEFISPPLPLDDAIEQVKLVKKWADERGAYTNRSTGLHMNVSVPDFNSDKLDFVKLTLLLGDNYILEKFGRSANTYCKSAMDIIAEAPSAEDKELLFKKLKNNLETIASKVIHSGRVGKFTSINPKDNRVEFRGPGGDWLDQNFSKVEDTLYRCVVALDAAVDTTKYRKEYLKKLTKMFAPSKGSIEEIFIQYAAGEISKTELKTKLKREAEERKRKKYSAQGIISIPMGDMDIGDWIVEYASPTSMSENSRICFRKTNEVSTDVKALYAAMDLQPKQFRPDSMEYITVTEYTGKHKYIVANSDNFAGQWEGGVAASGITPLHAIENALMHNPELYDVADTLMAKRTNDIDNQSPRPHRADEKRFTVTNNDTGHTVTLYALNGANARGRAIRNDPANFAHDANISVELADADSNQNQSTNGLKLWKISDSQRNKFEFVAATTIGNARMIAKWIYPILFVDHEPDFVLLDNASRTSISVNYALQQHLLEMLQDYGVGEPNNSPSFVVRATSREKAIEYARARFNIPAATELTAAPHDPT